MPYIAPDIILQAKKMDLLTYLQNYEPEELVRISSSTYSTRTHDSLKISNGKWMWWSRGIGGRSALDYLIKVNGYSFLDAVETITGKSAVCPPVYVKVKEKTEKKLLLPESNRCQNNVVMYLKNRGIGADIINFCIQTGRVYESYPYHNAVFVGLDTKGKAKSASLRGIKSDYIGEVEGSDKEYSFSIPAEEKSKYVHLFESAIDLLSYATLLKLYGRNWRKDHLLSLCGVYQSAKNIEQSKVPKALTRYFNEYPEINTLALHLDNDTAGRLASKAIKTVLSKQYYIIDKPPPIGKDYNDFLCMKLGIGITKRDSKKNERTNTR